MEQVLEIQFLLYYREPLIIAKHNCPCLAHSTNKARRKYEHRAIDQHETLQTMPTLRTAKTPLLSWGNWWNYGITPQRS